MIHPLSDRDLRDAERYADRAMPAAELAAFATRLQDEPALAEVVRQAEALRGVFAVARAEPPPAVRGGFSNRVLQRLRREAGVEAELAGRVEAQVVAAARWCLLAAAVLLGAAVLFVLGALRPADSGRLQADDQVLIRELDARIQAASQQPTGNR